MTLQEWQKKYDPRFKDEEGSVPESSKAAGNKSALAQWQEKYVPKTAIVSSPVDGTKSNVGGERFRFGMQKTPMIHDAPTATEKANTVEGYYSKPDLWGDADRYEKYLTIGKAQISAAETAANDAKGTMDSLYADAERLHAMYVASQSPAIYGQWEKAVSDYEAAHTLYDTAVSGYKDAAARYNSVLGARDSYLAGEQEKYDAWRGSVRPQETVQAERAAAELSIEALENRKGELSGSIIDSTKDTRGYAVDVSSHNAPITAEINEIDAQLKELYKKRDLLDEEYDWARYFGYEDMRSADDFGEKSKYVSTENGEGKAWADINGYAVTGYDDINYELINKNKEAVAKQRIADARTGASFAGVDKRELSQMTDDEIDIFNYLYALDEEAGDKKHTRAYEYVDYMTSDLNYRQRQKEAQYWKQYAKEHPVASSVFSVAIAPMKGLSSLGQAVEYAATGKIDENAGYNQFSHIPSDIRGEVSGIVEDKWGKVGSYAYNTGMSIADSVFNIAVAGAAGGAAGLSKAGTARLVAFLMGSEIMADEVIQSKERGLSDDQAFTKGIASAVIEAATEKFSVEALLDKTTLGKNALGYWLKNVLTEAGEEGASNIANTLADLLISRDKSEWQTAIDSYKKSGLSEKEAFGKALGDQAVSLGLDMLGGAISGGVMATPVVAVSGLGSAGHAYAEHVRKKESADKPNAALRAESTDRFVPVVEADGSYEDENGNIVRTDGTKITKAGKTIVPTPSSKEQGKRMKAAKTDTARTGIASGATDGQIKTAERLSKILKKDIRFFREGTDENGNITNGFYEENVIYVNSVGAKTVKWVVGHELTHSAELSEKYGDLQTYVLKQMKRAGIDVDEKVRDTINLYESHGATLNENEAKQEIVSDYAADYLFTDERAIRELVRGRPDLGQRILNWIDGFLSSYGKEDAEERLMLQKAKGLYAKALSDADKLRNDANAGKNTAIAGKTEPSETASAADRYQLNPEELRSEEGGRMPPDGEVDIDPDALDASIREHHPDAKLSVSRTAAENEQILSRMRSILQNGGSAADLRSYVNTLDAEERTQAKKKPQGTNTQRREDAASQIVRAAHRADMSVEEYLRENAELYETEDGWNREARRALQMEGRRYSISSVKIPTREELENKPDMKVVDISSPKTRGTFAERRKEILQQAENVIKKPYLNRDTNTMIFLTKGSYTHAFNNIGEIQLNAAEHLPEFIENAVLTHAEEPTHGSDYAEGVYTLFAAANDGTNVRPVKLKVKEYVYAGQDLPQNIKEYFENSPQGYAASYDTVVLEVEEIAENPPGSVKDMNQIDSFLDPEGLSEISIADLLSLVKGDAEKYIPKPAVKGKLSVSAAEEPLDGQVPLFNETGKPDGIIPDYIDADADFSGKQEISEGVRDELIKRTKEENERIRVEERNRKKEEWAAKRKKLDEKADRYRDPKTSRRALTDNLLSLFNVQPGSKKKLSNMIYDVCERIISMGRVMEEDVRLLMDVLYSSGVVVEHVDGELKNMGSAVENGFMYASPGIRGYFGENWAAFQERAYRAGVHFTTDQADASVETWRDELTQLFPGDFSQTDDPKTFLEKVVASAENGKVRDITLGKRTQELQDAGYVTEQEVIENLEREVRFQLRMFAEKASLETDLRKVQKAANVASAKLADERETNKEQRKAEREEHRALRDAERADHAAEKRYIKDTLWEKIWDEREDHQAQRAAERGAHRAHEQGLREKIEATRKEGAEKVREVKRKNEERWQKAIDMRRAQLKAQREHNKKMELAKQLLNKYKWVRSHMQKAPADLREKMDELIDGMDTYAIMPLSERKLNEKDERYGVTWREMPEYVGRLMATDSNFMISEDLKRKVDRVRARKIADMDIDAIGDALQALIGVQTEFYNRNNMLIAGRFEQIDKYYEDISKELDDTPAPKYALNFFNKAQLSAANFLRRMVGWNPESTFYKMAKMLEDGEYAMHRYEVDARREIDEFAKKYPDWVRRADGQGKDGIWITKTVPRLAALRFGEAPVFDGTVEIVMTPMMRIHMYLESKNVENLRHMAGGRTFADKDLYAKGKREEAFAKGDTVRLAPETVKNLLMGMSEKELELAEILHKYYNGYAKQEINRVSNILYGYDKAMGREYAPIYTNKNYVTQEPGVYNVTAEGAGNLKARQHSGNPSYQIGAMDAFDKHVDRTAKFVGYAIPIRNWTTLLNWREKGDSMRDKISHKWGKQGINYIDQVLEDLQTGSAKVTEDDLSGFFGKVYSNTIGAVFGLNPSVVTKQFGSMAMAGAELDYRNAPKPKQIRAIDKELIFRYTGELAYRASGNASAEMQLMRNNPNWAQRNKAIRFATGEAITATDQWTASVLWPWAENKVRREHPGLEVGTEAQIKAGESKFYKKVAEEFNSAVSHSQSVSDEMHQSQMRKSKNAITRTFTMFKSDAAQGYNQLRKNIGEAQFYDRISKDKSKNESARREAAEKAKKAKKKVGATVVGILINNAWATTMTLLMALWKNKGKNYRDDEDEFTAQSVMQQWSSDFFSGIAGTVALGEEIAEFIGNKLTGERWYDIEAPGVDVVNDLFKLVDDSIGGAFDFLGRGMNVLKDGGDVGKFLAQNAGEIVGGLKDTAVQVSSYFGIPAKNLETYLLGTFQWIAPGVATAYEDLLDSPERADLAGLKGKALDQRVADIMKVRGVTLDRNASDTLAAMYDAGEKGVIPSDIPSSFTVDGESYTLTETQKQRYSAVWAETVDRYLQKLIDSTEFRRSDFKDKIFMIGKVYKLGAEYAKKKVVPEYEIATWAEEVSAFEKAKLSIPKYLETQAAYSNIYDKEGDGKLKALDFARWVMKQKFTKAQREVVRECFGQGPVKYYEFIDEGVSENGAYRLAKGFMELKPMEGRETVSVLQKARAVVDEQLPAAEELAALSQIMTESEYAKIKAGNAHGITPGVYVTFKELLPQYDADGNGSYSQEEVERAIDSIGPKFRIVAPSYGSANAKNTNLTNAQRAVLWQIANKSWKPESNPYSVWTGRKVYEDLNK